MDKIDLTNIENLKERDRVFRICINNKKFDTSNEDDLAKILINHKNWINKLLIRYEYYLSKSYHNYGKGDLAFFDQESKQVYCVELKSLRDKYNYTTDKSKIDKCKEQAQKYAEFAEEWGGIKGIPISVIEYANGEIIQEEYKQLIIRDSNEPELNSANLEEDSDDWFEHPGDQTKTTYKIVDDCLYVVRISDNTEISSNSRKSFRKRSLKVAKEMVRDINKCDISIKTIDGQELYADTIIL